MTNAKSQPDGADSKFRLGLFGDTRSGKTVYLTALQWLAEEGQLPPGVEGLRPGDAESARYLGSRVAQLRAGQWPEGTIDTNQVCLLLDTPKKTIAIRTSDYRGGDFGNAWYDGDRDDTERFIGELFAKASAAVFLVDPGAIKESWRADATVEEQDIRERRITGVVTALETLRRGSLGFRLFHRPVAVVFTKCDEHRDVAEDPEAFARQYMRQTYDYLRRHARTRHRFFATSSTGPLAVKGGPPPKSLKPEKLLEPVLWCEYQHAIRIRLIKGCLAAVALLVLAAAYLCLYLANNRTIQGVRAETKTANSEEVSDLYRRARAMKGINNFLLTHPVERERLRQEVANAAESLLERDLHSRKDARGDLRTVADYVFADNLIRRFGHDFPGTENAKRLAWWLAEQREIQAKCLADRAMEAARAVNESEFSEIVRIYPTVATPTQDKRMEEARKILLEGIGIEAAKGLAIGRRIKPTEIGEIRGLFRRRIGRAPSMELEAAQRHVREMAKSLYLSYSARRRLGRICRLARRDNSPQMLHALLSDPDGIGLDYVLYGRSKPHAVNRCGLW